MVTKILQSGKLLTKPIIIYGIFLLRMDVEKKDRWKKGGLEINEGIEVATIYIHPHRVTDKTQL